MKSSKTKNIEVMATAVAAAALLATDIVANEKLTKAGRYMAKAASRSKRRDAASTPVQVLHADATAYELRTARALRAVRRGSEIYLPSWSDLTVGLPNVLLRSALFSASRAASMPVIDYVIATRGDVSLTLTGQMLSAYDKRIFAVCLDHYRDRPLAATDASAWIKTTFWLFAQALDVAPSPGTYKAIRASLLRLNTANLRVRAESVDMPIPRLLNVAFLDADGIVLRVDLDTPVASTGGVIAFRIHEDVATLFGPSCWTAVPKTDLARKEFLGWLASFYETHAAAYPINIPDLQAQSGLSAQSASDFRRTLTTGLTTLAADKTSRITGHTFIGAASKPSKVTVGLQPKGRERAVS